jgi:hypothetical protein
MSAKPYADMTFDDLVSESAGRALLRLIKGDNWRSIIWGVCEEAVSWRVQKTDAAKP